MRRGIVFALAGAACVACSSSPQDAGDAGAPPQDAASCGYPGGPYGVLEGQVLPPTVSWQGFRAGSDAAGTLGAQDLFDCDGTKGVDAIVFDTSTEWCEPCQYLAQSLEPLLAKWPDAKRIAFVQLLVQNAQQQPATVDTASHWRSAYGLVDVSVCADPKTTFAGPDFTGYPFTVVVDPRTMRVVERPATSAFEADPRLLALLAKNGP